MTLTELKYIVAVAQKMHFGQAAQACFVSQPTLSIAIRKLEDGLGVKLFERSSKNEIKITRIGEQIVAQAQKVIRESQVITEIAEQGKDPLKGQLKLGAIYTIGPYLFPQLIPALSKNMPHLKLIIEESFTASLSQSLKQGDLDAIIISYPFNETGIETQSLYEEDFVVAVPEKHAWTQRKKIDSKDLASEDLMLLGSGHCFRDQVIKACPDCMSGNSELTRTLEGGSLETIRHMVAAGTGITVLPCSSVLQAEQQQALISVRPFEAPTPSRIVAIAWRKNYPRKAAIDAIIDTISQCKMDCVSMINEKV